MEATQSLKSQISVESEITGVHISVEFVAYAILLLLSIVLRLAQLDVVPMTNAEAREALAAWRVVYPQAPGNMILSESPLLFLLHNLSFTTLGASELSSRIWTVLGSIALILTPLLFRALIGRGRAFILSLLFTFSPILLIASRTDSAVIWTILLGILALWAFWCYYETAKPQFAILLVILALSATLLTEATGWVFMLVLVGAGLFAFWMSAYDPSNDEVDTVPENRIAILRERFQTWPWLNSVLSAIVIVFIVGTQFMLHPQGLSVIGALLGASVRGLTTSLVGVPSAFPILITVFYEPVTIFLGVIAILWLVRQDSFNFLERFFAGWLLFGVVASLLYAGAGASHALWLVVPLAGLTSSAIVGLLVRVKHPLWWGVPIWSKWVVALCGIFLLSMFSIHVQALGRTLFTIPEGLFQFDNLSSSSLVFVIISVMSMVIGYFLAASLWGIETTTQGAALGLLAFGLVTSLGSGWRASVVTAENPLELWNREAISGDTALLTDSLTQIARRESGGYPHIPIVALAPEDGVVAWLLRDYVNTRFITDVNDARSQEIVLLPMYNEPPDLAGSYVGQTFFITKTWDPVTVQLPDLLSWWVARRTRVSGEVSNAMVLWLRQDIYNGVSDILNNGAG